MKFKKLDQSGQGMSEYLILVMLIAVASIAAAEGVGRTVFEKLSQIKRSINNVTIESVRNSEANRDNPHGI